MRYLVLLATAGTLLGQTPTAPVVQLAPVTVEARHPNESPATISRLELDGLPESDLTPAGIAARTANFHLGANGARSFTDTFALRGLTNTPIFGGPAISCYLDDLPLGQPFLFPSELGGFAAAELHRGPTQNTRFGRAGSAGVLTLLTPETPAGGAVTGEVRAGAGSHGRRSAALSVASAISPRADAFAAAGWHQRDGFITNTRLGRDIDGREAHSAIARVRLRPSAGPEWTILATGLRARDGVQSLVPLGGPLFSVARNEEGLTHLDAFNAAFTAAFDAPWGRLSATTSVNHWDLSPYASTLAFGPFELVNRVRQRQRTWNEEIRAESAEAAAVQWQAGVFASAGETAGAFDRIFGPFPFERSRFDVKARDLAGYGEASWQPAPALQLVAGLRAEQSRRELDRRETVPVVQNFGGEAESTALLPKLGLSYAPDRELTWFATAGAGYKPGGFSTFTGNRALAAFGPERTRTLEAGVIRMDPARSYSAAVRAFWYDIRGYQIERSFATSAVADDYLVVNAPRARSVGGEVEFSWRPVEGLTLGVDVGVTRVTLREFTDPYTGASAAGRRAPYVPVHDGSVRAEYRSHGWFTVVEVTRTGRVGYTEDEDPAFTQRAVTLVGAEFGWESRRGRVTIYGRNLGDEGYYSAITPGTGHGTPGDPLTYGAEFAWRW